MSSSHSVTPTKVVAAQILVSLLSALAWYLFTRLQGKAALSAILGGAICWVPSAFFSLYIGKKHRRAASSCAWILGESVKIALTAIIFVATAMLGWNIHWLALLVTYFIALKISWIALGWRTK
ncbi:ATP synthase subunit I [Candidatus Vallotia cooleyia]|uniref:ATP synthase subunit I n=1 Tax=Candidatus Vallotiella adelgis TaxID=1177211 RepID=UPI001D029671|nr:ATP synthase subunit I [Candidatus Vallotia cooleyia]